MWFNGVKIAKIAKMTPLKRWFNVFLGLCGLFDVDYRTGFAKNAILTGLKS